MRIICAVIVLLCIAFAVEAGRLPGSPFRRIDWERQTVAPNPEASTAYETFWYKQTLDHFDFTQTGTWMERYLVNDENWSGPQPNKQGQCTAPVLFYTGNEGDITLFYNNTGFITEFLGPLFNGLIVFAEHRYYGESMPFGDKSFHKDKVKYLSSEQALADYAQLIPYVKSQYNAEGCPVISFGGSYGGMLSSWFRMKYPNVVAGSIAASAPILLFPGTGASQWAFNEIITADFANAVDGCADKFHEAILEVLAMNDSEAGANNLTETFNFCETTNAYETLEWVEGAITSLAMADYPYPANFLGPLPAWPVTKYCEILMNHEGSILEALSAATDLYYSGNGTIDISCYNATSSGPAPLGDLGWDYQSCTEMIMPISSNGTSDMFTPSYFDIASTTAYCQYAWGVTPRPDWVPTYYGGYNEGADLETASNIVFSNGQLDPWRSGGVVTTYNPTIPAVYIELGAHHLDMRAPNAADPASVIAARGIEVEFIRGWITEYLSPNTTVDYQAILNSFQY